MPAPIRPLARHQNGHTYPEGTKEMFIGPAGVRVLVQSAEEEARWHKAHDDEMAKAEAPPKPNSRVKNLVSKVRKRIKKATS